MKNRNFLFPALSMLLISCGSVPTSPREQALYGTAWELEYLSGPRIAFEGLYPDKKPVISFEKSSMEVSGNGGCNGYSAEFTLDGEDISFGEPGPTTMMYCGNGEPEFLKMMRKVNRYGIDDDGKLNLMIDEVPMMRFKPVSE